MKDPLEHHMDKETFRRHGHAVIDWIADFLDDRVDGLPVMSEVEPGEIRSMLPDSRSCSNARTSSSKAFMKVLS